MLTERERGFVFDRGYVPEHLPDYAAAVSGAEPFLHGDYLCYVRGSHLIFVGYSLAEARTDPAEAYEAACRRFRPNTVAVMGPILWLDDRRLENRAEDSCYRLDLPLPKLDSELAYMIRRAEREARASEGTYGDEHHRLLQAFTAARTVGPGHEEIFLRIPNYLKSSRSARILEARRGDELVAFTIVDLGSASYAFYLFSVRSLTDPVPGASDLLFYEMVKMSLAAGKRALNLGLGINSGVRRFKEKWGGVPFVRYESALVRTRRRGLLSALMRP